LFAISSDSSRARESAAGATIDDQIGAVKAPSFFADLQAYHARMRVGIDLVSVQSVRDSISEHGEHYLRRVYTDQEVRDCTTAEGVDAERLAARFAAKEAALKVLRPGEEGLRLTCIEVIRDAGGWVGLTLTGVAAELAASAGLGELALSVSHEGGFACAVVVAA
jgi:holo-[acyl-carrier protein] synthase